MCTFKNICFGDIKKVNQYEGKVNHIDLQNINCHTIQMWFSNRQKQKLIYFDKC